MEANAFFILRLNDHIQYLRKIQATLDGTGEFRGTDFHDCKLGTWLYGSGPAEAQAVSPGAKALFERLFEPHERFHNASHAAIKCLDDGDDAGAKVHITEMMKLSVVLVDTLLELDQVASVAPRQQQAQAPSRNTTDDAVAAGHP